MVKSLLCVHKNLTSDLPCPYRKLGRQRKPAFIAWRAERGLRRLADQPGRLNLRAPGSVRERLCLKN